MSVPDGVLTLTLPLVAPTGTAVLISEIETTVNFAGTPLKLTWLAPVRLVPQDTDHRSHLTGSGLSLHERAQSHRETEHGAAAAAATIAAAVGGCSVKVAVSALHQSSSRRVLTVRTVDLCTEAVERCQLTRGSDLENCTAARLVGQALAGHRGGRLIVVDMVLPEDARPHPTKMLDLLMVMFPGGRERTASEWRDLLARAGFSPSPKSCPRRHPRA